MFTIISILQELIKRGWNNSERYGNFSKIDKPGGGGVGGIIRYCRENVCNTKFGILSLKAILLTEFIQNLIHKNLGNFPCKFIS